MENSNSFRYILETVLNKTTKSITSNPSQNSLEQPLLEQEVPNEGKPPDPKPSRLDCKYDNSALRAKLQEHRAGSHCLSMIAGFR